MNVTIIFYGKYWRSPIVNIDIYSISNWVDFSSGLLLKIRLKTDWDAFVFHKCIPKVE